MSNLLQIVKMSAQKKTGIPMMVEFPINPDCAPFLVSSSKEMLWIDEAHPGAVVKAAPRRDSVPGELFLEVLEGVGNRGRKDGWGNIHPFTVGGVREALDYVASYDLDDLEILVPRVRAADNKRGVFRRPDWLCPGELNVPVRPSGWLPDGCAVVVPRDREFVGMLGFLAPKTFVVVVHNPGRSIAIAWGRG